MFLHLLNDTQQKAFLALAKQFIEADSTLSDTEQNVFELALAESGQSFDEELPAGTLEELAQPFDSRQSRAVVLLEMIGIGHADDEFHPAESEFVNKLGAQFNIAAEEIAEMESWIQRQMALAQEVEKFWQE